MPQYVHQMLMIACAYAGVLTEQLAASKRDNEKLKADNMQLYEKVR
jgi:hypothetical protein